MVTPDEAQAALTSLRNGESSVRRPSFSAEIQVGVQSIALTMKFPWWADTVVTAARVIGRGARALGLPHEPIARAAGALIVSGIKFKAESC